MCRPPRFFAPMILGLTALAGAPATLGDEAENLRQLLAMPRERRVALSENLERFDKLDPAERAAIRNLDAEITRKDPTAQAKYRSLLRRYHLWFNGLTDEQKERLKAAPGDEARINLASEFRLKEMAARATGPNVFGIRSGDFGIMTPHDVAYLLRIWKRLTREEDLLFRKKESRKRIIDDLKKLHKEKGVTAQQLPDAEKEKYLDQLTSNEAFKLTWPHPEAKVKAKAKPAPRPDDVRLAEFLYFENHKSKPVAQANLERFSASCPDWLHEMLDPLSPDDARAYLTTVYRLLYPEGSEMPEEAKPARSQAAPKAETKPAAKKSGQAGPF
jgi:hypothetical protein